MKPEVTPEQRWEIHDLREGLLTRVKANKHFPFGTAGAIHEAAAERDIPALKAFEKFLTVNRTTISIQYLKIVLSRCPVEINILDLTEEQVDALLDFDSFLQSLTVRAIHQYRGDDIDNLTYLLLEDISRDQAIRNLILERSPLSVEDLRSLLSEMENEPKALRVGVL